MSVIKREAVSVVAVHKVNAGTDLLGDHASGVSALLVDDASAFNETGGTLSIDGDTLTYLSWSDVDDDTCSIALASPTTSAYDDETRVALLPLTPVMTADVVPAGGGPSLEATVWHSLDGYLVEGVRDPDDQESGLIHYTGDYHNPELVDARGKVPLLDPSVIPADGGDLDPAAVYIDGPPDFYADGDLGFGEGPLLTYAEMTAVADPAWVTVLDGITADNGTIVLNSEDPGGTFPFTSYRYYPVWIIPNEGRSFRVVLDDATFGGSADGIDVDAIGFTASLQDDAGSIASSGANVDSFSVTTESYPTTEYKVWSRYQDIYPDQFVGDIQNDPVQSATPTEPFGPDSEFLSLPQVAVCLTHPLYNYPGGWTTAHVITISGLRVEFV